MSVELPGNQGRGGPLLDTLGALSRKHWVQKEVCCDRKTVRRPGLAKVGI